MKWCLREAVERGFEGCRTRLLAKGSGRPYELRRQSKPFLGEGQAFAKVAVIVTAGHFVEEITEKLRIIV